MSCPYHWPNGRARTAPYAHWLVGLYPAPSAHPAARRYQPDGSPADQRRDCRRGELHPPDGARARAGTLSGDCRARLRPQERADTRVRKFDGKAGMRLVELACSPTPNGEPTWTLRMLTARLIELEVVEAVCVETVRTALQKTSANPG